jgi:hypothetical protein
LALLGLFECDSEAVQDWGVSLGRAPEILWSHSLQSEISFNRSVTISEKAHQVGGFRECEPKGDVSDPCKKIIIYCAVAVGE